MDAASLRERLHAILPAVRANVARAEAEARIPDDNVALLQQAGFFRAFVARRYGGAELLLQDFGPMLVDLAEACAATGWVAGLITEHAHAMALFSREMQDELWSADNTTLIGSSVAPVGVAEATKGGVTLSGRFGFSSGCDHVQWFLLGFQHPSFEPPAKRWYAMVPRSDVAILDDWDTLGMRGTGSKSLVVERVFVPEHRLESIFALNTGASKGFGSNDSAIFHAAYMSHFITGFAAVAIGAARRMTRVYADATKARIKPYTGASGAARAPASMRLGRAVHATEAALAFLAQDWRDIDAQCAARRLPTPDEMARWRTNQAFCIRLAVEAADQLMDGAGGRAWYASNELQMLWRNIHMCGAHAGTDYDSCSEMYGRHLLGLEPDPSL